MRRFPPTIPPEHRKHTLRRLVERVRPRSFRIDGTVGRVDFERRLGLRRPMQSDGGGVAETVVDTQLERLRQPAVRLGRGAPDSFDVDTTRRRGGCRRR